MICCKSSLNILLRQSYHFATDFDGVTANGDHSKQSESELLAAQCDLLVVNIQCATACSLQQFKLLYQLNHTSCLNKICKVSCANTHIPKVWLNTLLSSLTYRIISRGLCFIGTNCM